jgi:hypothetical protein
MSQKQESFNQCRRQILLLIAAGLLGSVSIARSQDMNNTEKHFKSLVELNILAIRAYPIEPGPRQSLPVPVLHQGQVQIAFMLCPQVLKLGPVRIRPPSKIIWLNPVSGNLIALTKVSPDDFSQTDFADRELPKWKFDSDLTIDAFNNLKKRLFELYDILFPAWADDALTPQRRENLKAPAREFLKIFNQVSEPPLRPYYAALGRDWFGWLRELAK